MILNIKIFAKYTCLNFIFLIFFLLIFTNFTVSHQPNTKQYTYYGNDSLIIEEVAGRDISHLPEDYIVQISDKNYTIGIDLKKTSIITLSYILKLFSFIICANLIVIILGNLKKQYLNNFLKTKHNILTFSSVILMDITISVVIFLSGGNPKIFIILLLIKSIIVLLLRDKRNALRILFLMQIVLGVLFAGLFLSDIVLRIFSKAYSDIGHLMSFKSHMFSILASVTYIYLSFNINKVLKLKLNRFNK